MFSPTCCMSTSKSLRPRLPPRGCPHRRVLCARSGSQGERGLRASGRGGAHTPKGLFLSSPNGGFLHRGCVLPYQHGGGRGSADSTLPHCEKDSIKAGAKSTGSSDLMIEAGETSTLWGVIVLRRCARPTGGSHARIIRGPAQRSRGVKRRPRCVY